MKSKIKKEWEDIANPSENNKDPFVSLSRNYLDNILLSEIGEVEGKKVMDLGCGNGDFTFKLKDRGADVLGVDISNAILDLARSKYPNINFLLHDFIDGRIDVLTKYDVVVLELVIMFVNEVDDLLRNLSESLTSDAKLYVSILHPFYLILSQYLAEASGFSIQGFDDYFVEQVLRLESEEVDLTYFSRSVSWYVKKFVENGFEVIDMEEPKFIGGGQIDTTPLQNTMDKVPSVMLFTLQKD